MTSTHKMRCFRDFSACLCAELLQVCGETECCGGTAEHKRLCSSCFRERPGERCRGKMSLETIPSAPLLQPGLILCMPHSPFTYESTNKLINCLHHCFLWSNHFPKTPSPNTLLETKSSIQDPLENTPYWSIITASISFYKLDQYPKNQSGSLISDVIGRCQ